MTNISLISIFLGNRSNFFLAPPHALTDLRLGSGYAAVHRQTQTIMPIQHAKSLYTALRIQIIKNPEAFMICHYQHIDAVDIMSTITMV